MLREKAYVTQLFCFLYVTVHVQYNLTPHGSFSTVVMSPQGLSSIGIHLLFSVKSTFVNTSRIPADFIMLIYAVSIILTLKSCKCSMFAHINARVLGTINAQAEDHCTPDYEPLIYICGSSDDTGYALG